jgi:hypothetical protein
MCNLVRVRLYYQLQLRLFRCQALAECIPCFVTAVAEGAYLDMRFVHVVRAYGDKVSSYMKVIAGACVTVMPGATFIATG